MRISLVAGLNNKSPVDTCISDLTQARDEGFRRVWLTQMPYDVDLLTVLAATLREVPDIDVGSAVLPIQNQHPMLLAQRALTLNMIANGRFTLGIGVTHRAVTEGMWGISWDRSVRAAQRIPRRAAPAAGREGRQCLRRAGDHQRSAADSRRTDAAGVRCGAGAADVAGRGSAHRGHDHLDDRPEDAARAHRPDSSRRGGAGRS